MSDAGFVDGNLLFARAMLTVARSEKPAELDDEGVCEECQEEGRQ